MKSYNYKKHFSILFGLVGLLWFIGFILQLLADKYMVAILYLVCTIMSFLNALVYRRPYLKLGDGKISISNGVFKKEILIGDITNYDENGKWFILNFHKGNTIKKKKILLSNLEYNDGKQFTKDFRKMLKS